MLGWRLLLATGDPGIGDDIERTLYNAVLPGVSLDGATFFYVNPLQRRTVGAEGGSDHPGRAAWYACACCPPNLMRVIASLPQMIASTDGGGVQVHQFASGEIRAGGGIRLAVETGYPWNGRIAITVLETPAGPWSLSVRVPGWATSARVAVASGESAASGTAVAAVVRESRAWRPGDTLTLDLDLPVRRTRPHPRVDAIRGCVALERGPLVYCIESADLPGGVEVEDLAVHPEVVAAPGPRPDLGPDLVGLALPALAAAGGVTNPPGRPVEIGAVPYFAWGNRGVRGMRVWIPTDEAAPRGPAPRGAAPRGSTS